MVGLWLFGLGGVWGGGGGGGGINVHVHNKLSLGKTIITSMGGHVHVHNKPSLGKTIITSSTYLFPVVFSLQHLS